MEETLLQTYGVLVAYFTAYEQIVIATILGLILVLGIITVSWPRKKPRKLLHRGRIMGKLTKKEEDLILRNEIGYALTDFLEEKFLTGQISAETASLYYRRFANILSIPDLLPRNQKVLKEKIKDNLQKKEVLYKPVPIPGPGPIKEVKKNKFKSSLRDLILKHAA